MHNSLQLFNEVPSSKIENWYVAFISIIFGLFISVWIAPVPALLALHSNNQLRQQKIVSWDCVNTAFLMARGLITFIILVCLWWWYAFFIGRLSPANNLYSYMFAFFSLAVFALGFRLWHTELLFPAAVFFGASAMIIRVSRLRRECALPEVEGKALNQVYWALKIILGSFVAAGVGAIIATVIYHQNQPIDPLSKDNWKSLFQVLVLLLLVAGVFASVRAHRIVSRSSRTDSLPSSRDMPSTPYSGPQQQDSKAPQGNTEKKIGDMLEQMALTYAAKKNTLPLFQKLRQGDLAKDWYLRYICSMYPIVVGFNRALMNSMTKLDPIGDSEHIRGLCKQLAEEQIHNELWRKMLRSYGICDHQLYKIFIDEHNRLGKSVLTHLTEDILTNVKNKHYSGNSLGSNSLYFPEAVHALYCEMQSNSIVESVDYWVQFAG
jgi:hypothetical protein